MLRGSVALILTLVLLSLVVNLAVIGSQPRFTILMGTFAYVPVGLIPLWLLQNGRVAAAAWVLLGGMLAMQTVSGLLCSGLETGQLLCYANLILLAGFTLGRRVAVYFSGIVVVVTLLQVLSRMVIPLDVIEIGLGGRTVSICSTLLTTGGIVVMALSQFGRIIQEEQDANEALALARDELALRADLGERLLGLIETLSVSSTRERRMQLFYEQVLVPMGLELCWMREGLGPWHQLGVETNIVPEISEEILPKQGYVVVPPERWGPSFPDADGVVILATLNPLLGPVYLMAATTRAREEDLTPFLESFATGLGLLDGVLAREASAERLRRSQKMDALGTLAAGISHDFNNLLATILGSVEMAQLATEKVATESHLRAIHVATRRASGLTKRMAALTRDAPADLEALDLLVSISEFEPVLARALPKATELKLELGPDPLWALGTRTGLEQVLLNLVLNAAEAGATRVVVRSTPMPTGGGHVCLEVADNGIGIEPHLVNRIFEPFYTTKAETGGHGLGLAGVYTTVMNSGGEISVESSPNGTTFSLRLPSAVAEETASITTRASRLETSLRILIVDDDADCREMAAGLLAVDGLEVEQCASAVEALRRIESTSFDLIVTDVGMPNMSGPQFVEVLRQADCSWPVLFISGLAEPDGGFAHLQPARYIQKPFGLDELRVTIHALLAEDENPVPVSQPA